MLTHSQWIWGEDLWKTIGDHWVSVWFCSVLMIIAYLEVRFLHLEWNGQLEYWEWWKISRREMCVRYLQHEHQGIDTGKKLGQTWLYQPRSTWAGYLGRLRSVVAARMYLSVFHVPSTMHTQCLTPIR